MDYTKHLKFMLMAEAIATFSKDPSTKVGAVILDDDCVVLSAGWNGFPRGVEDSEERLCNRDLKYPLTVHAEANAIAASARKGHSTKGAIIVVSSLFPCVDCAGLIAQAGIKAVIAPPPNNPRWKDSNLLAQIIFEEAGVELVYG
jgi:dCMP deaminase